MMLNAFKSYMNNRTTIPMKKPPIKRFVIQIVIENKPYINDPEGETIHRNLVLKGGYSKVESIRSAKMLKMIVKARTDSEAKQIVHQLCDDLRIFNSVVSNCTISSANKSEATT